MTHLRHILIAVAAPLLASCNGIMGDIYDDALPDDSFAEGFVNADDSGNRFRLMVDATDYMKWLYIDLADRTITPMPIPTELEGEWDGVSGWTYNEVAGSNVTQLSVKPTSPQDAPEKWDFAIHHFDVRTNGGAGVATPYKSIDEAIAKKSESRTFSPKPDVWSTAHVITDLSNMMAYHIGYQNIYVNEELSTMVTMDFSTPPPTYHTSGAVYIMQFADGSEAAVQLLRYMSPTGSKGYLTFDILYPY